jgi:hypothetical protein
MTRRFYPVTRIQAGIFGKDRGNRWLNHAIPFHFALSHPVVNGPNSGGGIRRLDAAS